LKNGFLLHLIFFVVVICDGVGGGENKEKDIEILGEKKHWNGNLGSEALIIRF